MPRQNGLHLGVAADAAAAGQALAALQQQMKETTDAMAQTGAAAGQGVADTAAALTAAAQTQNAAALEQVNALATAQRGVLAGIANQGAQTAGEAARQSAQSMAQMFQPVEQAVDRTVLGMLRGTTSARGAIAAFGDSLVASELAANTKRLAQWVATEAAKTASTTAGNAARMVSDNAAGASGAATQAATAIKAISTDSAQSFGGVFAFLAPTMGPAAAGPAAAAQAAVMAAAGGIASAAGGWDRVPADGMLAQLHKDEMVLPAGIASPLRDALGGMGQASGVAPGPPGGGVHYAPVVHLNAARMSRRDVEAMLRDHAEVFGRHLRNAARNGGIA